MRPLLTITLFILGYAMAQPPVGVTIANLGNWDHEFDVSLQQLEEAGANGGLTICDSEASFLVSIEPKPQGKGNPWLEAGWNLSVVRMDMNWDAGLRLELVVEGSGSVDIPTVVPTQLYAGYGEESVIVSYCLDVLSALIPPGTYSTSVLLSVAHNDR